MFYKHVFRLKLIVLCELHKNYSYSRVYIESVYNIKYIEAAQESNYQSLLYAFCSFELNTVSYVQSEHFQRSTVLSVDLRTTIIIVFISEQRCSVANVYCTYFITRFLHSDNFLNGNRYSSSISYTPKRRILHFYYRKHDIIPRH